METNTGPRPFLQAAIAFMVAWLFIGFLTDLPIAGFAKATSGLAFVPILLLARSWQIPPILFAYPAVAIYLIFAVSGTENRIETLVIRFYWFLLVMAAIALASRVHRGFSLEEALKALLIGGTVCLALLAAALFVGDALWIELRNARIWVLGGNPNLVGTVPMMIMPLALFRAWRSGGLTERYVWAAVAALSLTILVLFVGRAALVLALVPCIPLVWSWWRRPAAVVLPVLLLAAVIFGPVGDVRGGDLDLQRLLEGSAASGRVEIAKDYLGLISARPAFGLAPTEGHQAGGGSQLTHTHSAYLELLYLGGLVAFLPIAAVSIAAVSAGINVLRNQPRERVLLLVLLLQLAASVVHAVANRVVLYPTYSWAFYHVFLAAYFLISGTRLKKTQRTQGPHSPGRTPAGPDRRYVHHLAPWWARSSPLWCRDSFLKNDYRD